MPAPLAPRPLLFLTPHDSDFARYLVEVLEVAERHPEILRRTDADLDAHALGKKALRVADARWEANRSASLPGMETDQLSAELRLGVGRPRTPAWVVCLGLAVRGYQGGFKSCDTDTLLLEPLTWCVLLANRGCPAPRPGTLADLVNQVSNATRTFILDAQIHDVLEASWDDFSQVQMDSTPVAGNTQWPNDSRLMVTLVQRVLHVGERLGRVGLPAFFLPPWRRGPRRCASMTSASTWALGSLAPRRNAVRATTNCWAWRAGRTESWWLPWPARAPHWGNWTRAPAKDSARSTSS